MIASAEYGGELGKASEVNCHRRTFSVISAIVETALFDLMTPTEEFSELRDWFAREKREPGGDPFAVAIRHIHGRSPDHFDDCIPILGRQKNITNFANIGCRRLAL
jgi:hypothetical protein